MHPDKERIVVRELRTHVNGRLYVDDQLIDVVKEGDQLIAITEHRNNDKREPQPGDMVLQYHLLELIGEGTYGLVFKGKDLNLNRYVAVKVLRAEKANDVNTRRFLREAELNGLLSQSPYVVTVHDFGRTATGVLFIVMELLKGQPLNALLDERISEHKPFTSLECVHVLSPVLRGLHAAHSHQPGVIHRDVKPDNIWLTEQNENAPLDIAAKIMDFGIAVLDDTATQACGTRMYASPEQVRKNAKVDSRSDIWSVGVILYQMLTLLVDVPFDPLEVNMGAKVPDVRLHSVTPISDHMAAICMRALQVHPADRWPSAEAMADALHKEESALLMNTNLTTTHGIPRPLSLNNRSAAAGSSSSSSGSGVTSCTCRCSCSCSNCICLTHQLPLNKNSALPLLLRSGRSPSSYQPANLSVDASSGLPAAASTTPIMLSDPQVPGNGRALTPLPTSASLHRPTFIPKLTLTPPSSTFHRHSHYLLLSSSIERAHGSDLHSECTCEAAAHFCLCHRRSKL